MSYHLYDIDELYTNDDGTIQFVELSMPNGGNDGENHWGGPPAHELVSTNGSVTHVFSATDLLNSSTQNTHVLLATAGFQAASGITPDFILPDNFLFATGGTISWGSTTGAVNGSGTVDTVVYSGLPIDGSHSWNININSGHEQSSGVNSPTNFAFQTGRIDNHAPVVNTPLVDKITGGGQAFTYQFAASTFSDADSDTLSYVAKLSTGGVLPAWLSFNASTRTFSGTPASTDAGTLNIKVTASDGFGGKGMDVYKLQVISGFVVNGTTAGDTLNGTNKADLISGKGGADVISGGGGADTISGGTGTDTLTGGGGADKFVFAEAPSRDAIQDFTGASDRIQLENAVFTAFVLTGQVMAGNIQTGLQSAITAGSGDADDFLKYATNTGRLYYDADGSGPEAPHIIATIHSSGTAFDPANDVFVI